jgi:hypothetical protein
MTQHGLDLCLPHLLIILSSCTPYFQKTCLPDSLYFYIRYVVLSSTCLFTRLKSLALSQYSF